MKDLLCDQFQADVESHLIRHKSVLDTMTKLTEANARVGRALAKAVAECGCIKVVASRQTFPEDIPLEQLSQHADSHLRGQLCDSCREALEEEIGQTLFYLTGVASNVGISVYDCLLKEHQKITTLGSFNLF